MTTEIGLAFGPDDEMTLNMGPHHPSTHGVLRFIIKTDGEIVRRVTPDVGYLHRAHEKIAERCTYLGFMPYTDRSADYVAAMFGNDVWARACEKLGKIVNIPARAEYLRLITCELSRIASHMIGLGTMAMDVGAVTPFPYCLREREYINDFIEEMCGARLTYNYHRIGGVSFDMPPGWRDKILKWLDHFEMTMDEFDRLITRNLIFVKRLAGVATIDKPSAVSFGLVGPNLRASGVDWDLRRDEPYGLYPQLKFEVPVGRAFGKDQGVAAAEVGDSYDRFVVRVEECRQSAKILRQALDRIVDTKEGEIKGEVPRRFKPEGEAYARVESARGDMAVYVIGAGGEGPYRARLRTGSFNAMGIIEHLSPGLMIADVVALVASLDVVAPEVDR